MQRAANRGDIIVNMQFEDYPRATKRPRLNNPDEETLYSDGAASQDDCTNSEDFDFDAFDAEEEQWQNQERFKHRMEDIFQRYSMDWSAQADEINIRTGVVEVDRGHLAGLPYADFDEDDYDYESFTSDEDGILEDHDNDILDLLQTPMQGSADWMTAGSEQKRDATPRVPSRLKESLSQLDLPSEETILRQFGPIAPAVLDIIREKTNSSRAEPAVSVSPELPNSEVVLDDLSILNDSPNGQSQRKQTLSHSALRASFASPTPLNLVKENLPRCNASATRKKEGRKKEMRSISTVTDRLEQMFATRVSSLQECKENVRPRTSDPASPTQHRLTDNVDESQACMPCPTSNCGQIFTTAFKLAKHMRKHQQWTTKTKSSLKGRYPCNMCEKVLTSQLRLIQHKSIKHAADADGQCPSYEKRDMVRCKRPSCNRYFFSQARLAHHMSVAHSRSKVDSPQLHGSPSRPDVVGKLTLPARRRNVIYSSPQCESPKVDILADKETEADRIQSNGQHEYFYVSGYSNEYCDPVSNDPKHWGTTKSDEIRKRSFVAASPINNHDEQSVIFRPLSKRLFSGWRKAGKPPIVLRLVDSSTIIGPKPDYKVELCSPRSKKERNVLDVSESSSEVPVFIKHGQRARARAIKDMLRKQRRARVHHHVGPELAPEGDESDVSDDSEFNTGTKVVFRKVDIGSVDSDLESDNAPASSLSQSIAADTSSPL